MANNPKQKRNPEHGIILYEFIRDTLGISQANFAREMNINRSAVNKWIAEGIPYQRFGHILITYGTLFPFKECGITLPTFNQETKSLEPSFHSINHKGTDEEYQKSIEKYFNTLCMRIEKVEKNISIYNYLGRLESETFRQVNLSPKNIAFHQMQDKYFDSVYLQLEDKDISYNRILAVPFKAKKRINSNDVDLNTENFIKQILSREFKHICKCFSVVEKNPNKSFNLYITIAPPSLVSFACIDKKTLITEGDRYGRSGIPKPKRLTIYPSTSKRGFSQSLLKEYQQEVNNLITEGNNSLEPVWKIGYEEFKNCTKSIHHKVSTNLDKHLQSDSKENSNEFTRAVKELQVELKDLENKLEIINQTLL